MNHNKQVIERAIARDYWALKAQGTVEGLCEQYKVSRPRLLRIAARFRQEFENKDGGACETVTPNDEPNGHQGFAAQALSVPANPEISDKK
jgi:hypothetical protein